MRFATALLFFLFSLTLNAHSASGANDDTCRITNSVCTHGGSAGSLFHNLEIRREKITLNITAAPTAQTPNVYNYADSVIAFSSEWTAGNYGHNQVLGHFNTYPCYGDIATAWASQSPSAEREFLELYFNNAAPIDSIFIYETYNAGAVDTVYVKNPNTSNWEVVYTATPTNITSSRILKIGFPKTTFDVSEVRIAIFSQGTSWNEIDAVAINSVPDETPDTATLTCNNSSLSIGSSCGTTSIGDATFLWTTPTGNILSGANTAHATIDAPGLYTLSVTKNNDVVSYDVLVNSSINAIPPTDYNQTLCNGQNITVNGTSYDQNNPTGTETLLASSGCDSIVNINLAFLDSVFTYINQTLCYEESLTINGTVYNRNHPSGADTLTTASGCDSIININLTFLDPIYSIINKTLCTGENFILNGVTYDQNNPSGAETLTTAAGCDSVVNINLFFLDPIDTTIEQTLCAGEDLTVNNIIYNQGNPAGTQILTAASGCDSTINISLDFFTNGPEVHDDDFIILAKEDTIVDIISNDSLPDDWTIEIINSNYSDYFSVNYDGDIEIYSHLAQKGDLLNITYQICDQACTELCSTGQIHVNFNFLDQHKDVLVSDVLTLNGDGKNDILFFKTLTYNNMGIQVFNRWGDLVFAENPYTNQWNGTNQSGANLPNGTYYYILTINRAEGNIQKGDVLLVR